MAGKKQDVITLKVDRSLAEALGGVANRSLFIRDAILHALDNSCPLCMGTGILTPAQKRHWVKFAEGHAVRECPDCHERHLTCQHEKPARRRKAARAPSAKGAARSRKATAKSPKAQRHEN